MKSQGNPSVSRGQALIVSLDLIEGLCATMSPFSPPFFFCVTYSSSSSLMKAVQAIHHFISFFHLAIYIPVKCLIWFLGGVNSQGDPGQRHS